MQDKLWAVVLIVFTVLGSAAINAVMATLSPNFIGLIVGFALAGIGGWAAGRCAARSVFYGRITNGR